MRWSNLTADGEDQRRLPGYRDPASVRRFQAPEALDMRFYEVQAKSVLNRVPEASRMPFRWTVNPYRGCSHACRYCASPDTLVLMADGRNRRIADLRVGDEIYGTVRRGRYRRYIRTEVLDKWSSIKPAFQVELEDGTQLVSSEDHRFLTARGWKHVIGTESGPLQRPHLTLGARLLGPGGCVAAPVVDDDYRRGYLCGVVRGDRHIGSYLYTCRGGKHENLQRFRLALADQEALDRTALYLDEHGVATTEFSFAVATATRRSVNAIRAQSSANVERIEELIAWPIMPSLSWLKGFLAGIFDAEGGCRDHMIRISSCDPEIIRWIRAALERLQFEYVIEHGAVHDGLIVVRIGGGLAERMRFFLGTDPAITRKRTIEGDAVKGDGDLRVASIRPLGLTMRMYDITTGTGDFIADGVISHNCFARPTHTYLGFDAGRDFEREIVVKVNAPEVLRAELAKKSWRHEHVAMGTNTDPYQWVEGRYKLMRGILEALRDAANPCSILTKSPLLLRDIELMLEIAARASFSACLSIPTLEENAWRETEPHTPHPRARMEAVAELNRRGIPTGILIAPLMPGVNDSPEQVQEIVDLAQQAGATSIGGIALHLRKEVRQVFMGWLEEARPELVPRYKELYRRGAYAPVAERRRIARMVRKGDGPGSFRAMGDRYGHRPEGPEEATPRREPALQQSLF